MILVFSLFLLLLTLLAYFLFRRIQFFTENFEGKKIPYSLGTSVLLGYLFIIFGVFPNEKLTNWAVVLYVVLVWLTGLLDDVLGTRYPKGIRGHFRMLLNEGKVTTGLMKIVVTTTSAIVVVMLYEKTSVLGGVIILLLLLLTPHVMNLFDTRPLRTMKFSLLYLLLFIPLISINSASLLLYVGIILLVLYQFEANKLAMLGDNGATALGAIFALCTIFYSTIAFQVITVVVLFGLTILAEKFSFSKIIERNRWLKRVDLIGNATKER